MISAFGVEHGDISKGLKPRHIKALMADADKYYQSSKPLETQHLKDRAVYAHRRAIVAETGQQSQRHYKRMKELGGSVSPRTTEMAQGFRAESRAAMKNIDRKRRKNTRMGLFRTDVGERASK